MRRISALDAANLGYTLFINCTPQNQNVRTLDQILAPLAKQVEAELQVADYRLAEYSKGKDALVYALKELLTQEPPTGNVVVDVRTPCIRPR